MLLPFCLCCFCRSADDLLQASLKVEPLIEDARAAATAAANQPAAAVARVRSTCKLHALLHGWHSPLLHAAA